MEIFTVQKMKRNILHEHFFGAFNWAGFDEEPGFIHRRH